MGVRSLSDDDFLNEESSDELLGKNLEDYQDDEDQEQEEEQEEEQQEESSDDSDEQSDDESSEEEEEEQQEEEQEEQEEQQEDQEQKEAPAKGQKSVPSARFNKVISERNALREELEALKSQVGKEPQQAAPTQQQKPASKKDDAPEYDFDKREEDYADAILLGDTKKAREIRKEINEKQAFVMEQRVLQASTTRYQQDKEQERFMGAVAALQGKYTFLDAASKDANKDAIDEVVSFRDMYMTKGMSPTEALFKAVERVVPMYARPEEKKPEAKKEVSERTKKSLEKAVDTANKTPPRTNGVGVGNRGSSDKINPAKLSIDAWEKLSDSERRKLLG